MRFRSLNAKEYYYARFHAVQAAGKLRALQGKLKAMPSLNNVHRFTCELKIAQIQAASTARDEAYWERKFAEELRYSPDQPRVPAGHPTGGQWTSDGENNDSARAAGGGSDAANVQVIPAQFTPEEPRGAEEEFPDATPAQQARLVAAQAQAEEALSRVRDVDPSFTPSDSLTVPGSIEGAIAQQQSIAQEAQARVVEIYSREVPTFTEHGNLRIGDRSVSESEIQEALTTAQQTGNIITKVGKYGTLQFHYVGTNGITAVVETAGRNAGKVITLYRNK